MNRSMSCYLAGMLCVGLAVAPVCAKARKPKSTKAVEKPSAEKKTSSKKAADIIAATKAKTFNVYTDKTDRTNHYIPSGWMGDYGDINIKDNWRENPRSGTSCLKITYSAKGSQGAGWAGVYWQNPANNWGKRPGGFDLTGARRLTFWARGAQGGEYLDKFGMGGISGEYPDTDSSETYDVELTTEWQQFTVDLTDRDLSHIVGGFFWAANGTDNPDGMEFYLDDIVYEFK